MEKISFEQYLIRQPGFPNKNLCDEYYYKLSNHLLNLICGNKQVKELPESAVRKMILGVVGYFQDVVSDAGVWRSFTQQCEKQYGKYLPLYDIPNDYVEAELNKQDILFMVWYGLSMNSLELRDLNPKSEIVISISEMLFADLESRYEDAPHPEGYNLAHQLDLKDAEDAEQIYHFGNWLFMHCYLMTPAFALTLSMIAAELQGTPEDNYSLLKQKLEQSMFEDPTGPLALYSREWIHLILTGEMPSTNDKDNGEFHQYYKPFIEATGGNTIKFIGNYTELIDFFINALGWDKNEEYFPQFKDSNDFVLMINPIKGLLIAKDICRAIASPDNPYYEKDWADKHAFDLLTVRGCCPGDLLRMILKNGWLVDAHFPGSNDKELVTKNADFIARCYLQQYYRGD